MRLVSALVGMLALGFALGAFTVDLAGYQAMQETVQSGVREMRARALAGDEVSARGFAALSAYVQADEPPASVFFAKGLHIHDDGFWTP